MISRIKLILYMIIMAVIVIPQSAIGLTPRKTLITDSFIIYYPKGYELQAYNALLTLEYHRPYVEELTGNKRKRFPIIIEDIGNVANGFANPVGDRIVLFNHLPTNSPLDYVEDWWTMLGVHEYIHILQMTNEGGIPKALRKVFGNIMYTNWLQASFMLEGITVFGESDIHPYSGRMNGGYYPALVSTLALSDQLPNHTEANYFSADSPLGNFYVYGGSFYSYLAEKHGKDKFSELYDLRGRSLKSWTAPIFPGIGLDNAFRRVYGKSIPRLWTEWKNFEKAKDFDLPDTYLTDDGWYKSSMTLKGNRLYYLARDFSKTGAGKGFVKHSLKSYDLTTGVVSVLHKQAGSYPAGYHLSFDNDSEPVNLYYTRNEYKTGFANTARSGLGTVPELYKLNLQTYKREKLFQGSFRAFGVLNDGTVLISKDIENHLGSEIYRIDGSNAELIMTGDYLIHKIFEDRGTIYVNARSFWRNSSIFELDLEKKQLVEIIDNPVSENISGFYEDMIIYTANYDDYLSSYLINLETKEVKKIAGSSFMTSANIGNDTTYYLSLSPEGYEIAAAKLLIKDFNVPDFPENPEPFSQIKVIPEGNAKDKVVLSLPPAYSRSSEESLSIRQSGYWHNIAHLLVPRQYRIPSVMYSDDELIVTYEIGGNDAVGHFPGWSAILRYDAEETEFNYEFHLKNRLLLPVKHDLFYSNIDNQTIVSNQYIDLLSRMNWGINNVRAGINYQTKEDFERKIVNPFIDVGLHGYNKQMWNRFSLVTEREDFLSSDRNRNGIHIYNNVRHKLPFDSELVFRLHSAYDPDADSDEVFDNIRGYSDGLLAKQGFVLQSSLSKVLFEVRRGLWDPQIYVDDIGLSLFFDTAVPRSGEGTDMQYSFGTELLAETHFGFFFPIFLGYRISYNREQEIKHSFTLHTSFLFDSFWKW